MNNGWRAFAIGCLIAIGAVSLRSTQNSDARGDQIASSPPSLPPGMGPAMQRQTLTTASDGTVTWTYPVPYGAGVVPWVGATAQATQGSTDVINVQLDGAPTNTQAKFRVTRTQITVAALLGLNILSVPASPGATVIKVSATDP